MEPLPSSEFSYFVWYRLPTKIGKIFNLFILENFWQFQSSAYQKKNRAADQTANKTGKIGIEIHFIVPHFHQLALFFSAAFKVF